MGCSIYPVSQLPSKSFCTNVFPKPLLTLFCHWCDQFFPLANSPVDSILSPNNCLNVRASPITGLSPFMPSPPAEPRIFTKPYNPVGGILPPTPTTPDMHTAAENYRPHQSVVPTGRSAEPFDQSSTSPIKPSSCDVRGKVKLIILIDLLALMTVPEFHWGLVIPCCNWIFNWALFQRMLTHFTVGMYLHDHSRV